MQKRIQSIILPEEDEEDEQWDDGEEDVRIDDADDEDVSGAKSEQTNRKERSCRNQIVCPSFLGEN